MHSPHARGGWGQMVSNSLLVTTATESDLKVELDTVVTVLDVGIIFCYRIPTFSVIFVDLRRVKVQIHNEGLSTPVTVDAFIRADPILDGVVTPLCVNPNKFSFVPVNYAIIYKDYK